MTTISHDTCRQAVAADALGPEVADHLDRCPACARFAVRLREVTDAAATIGVPDPPPGLADRVLERVVAEAARPAPRRGAGRWSLYTGLAVAAAVAVVLGTLAVVGRDAESPREILLAAATRTEDSGSAEVRVEGGGEVAVPPGAFDAAPDEMQAYMERQWDRMMAEFDRALAEFEAAIDRTFDAAFGGSGRPPHAPPSPPRPPDRAKPEPPPDRATLGFAFTGSGAVEFGRGVALRGSVRPVAGTVAAPDAAADFAVAADAGDAGATGPLGSVLLAPDGVTRLLRAAEGEVNAEGTAEVDGVRTNRYRFRAVAVDASGATAGWEVDAYIDRDRLVRRVDVRASGRLDGAGAWSDRATIRLSGFGAARVDRAGSGPPPVAPESLPLHPFGPALATSLGAGR